MTSNLHYTKVNLPLVRIKGKAGKLAKNEHSGTKREIMRLWSDTMTREHEGKGRHWRQNSVQFSSVAQSCPTLCDPTDYSTPGLPVHHQLPEFTQTHVHWVSDAIQPSHPLSSPSPPAFRLSQHQSLFQWVSSSHQVVKVLEFQLQHQSFQRIFRIDFLQDGLVGSLGSPRDSQDITVLQHYIL